MPVKQTRVPFQLPDPDTGGGVLKRFGGSANDTFNNILFNQVVNALWLAHSDKDDRDSRFVTAALGMAAVRPNDEIEGMLAAQMVAAHTTAMECYRRAMLQEQTYEGRRENLNQANKLTRSYAMLMDTLDRRRGKGQQKVTVEHVHVHKGGQAIVGNVTGGGGGAKKSEEQPDAKQIAHAPGKTLPSEIQAHKEAVPGTSG